jgi:RHS repeat-associated protein
LATDYRFTGQRSEEANLGSLYDYGARFYSPVLGRFISADTIVPRPGDPQSLNRYTYVRNNPLRLVDPSGNAECAAGATACWQSEWEWKDRWYRAHGYDSDGNRINPEFKDDQIAGDILREAGINFGLGPLPTGTLRELASGVALFAQRLDSGMQQLRHLLGTDQTPIWITTLFGCGAASCAPPNMREVWMPITSWPMDQIATTFVHELAHVIDWRSSFLGLTGFSAHWGYAPLTNYAAGQGQPYPVRWDRWAEAVTVWVFGGVVNTTQDFATGYKTNEVSHHVDTISLNVQMNRMTELLNGRR